MANFSATSSGDFSSYLAGKVLNAANMAKGEKNRREEAGLEQAQPGSLFGKALQSEFGGDLYSRTFGIFDPRKSHGETDRNSSKEARFTAQFPEAKEKDSDGGGRPSGSSQEVEQAKQDLLRDDEKSVPVQDKNLRAQFSKIFGSIDVKLLTAEAKIEQSSSKLSVLHQDVLNTQKLILDQNAVLETKFDQILEIFGKQIEFQKELADDAQVKAKENELEEGQNRSTARGIIATGTAGGDLSTAILGFLGRKLGKRLAKPVKSLVRGGLQVLANRGSQRAASILATRGATSAAENVAGKAFSKSNLAARALRSPAVRKALIKKLGKAGAKKLTAKIAAKLIPGVSTAYGLGEGLTRIALGDVKGGFLSFGSAIPVAGYGFAAVDIFRDIDIDAYTKHIEPNLPAPSDENVGAFFAEALGVMPNQYEQGTARSRRGLASPGPAMLHGKEAILTPEDRRRITQFSVDSINSAAAKMVSTAVAFGDSSGNGSAVRSIFNKLGIDYPLERVAFRFDIGKKSSGGSAISKMFSEAAAAMAGMMNSSSNRRDGTDNPPSGGFTGLPEDYQKFYDHLVSKGASPNHAMGMVLNLARESSANPGAMANWNGTGLDANGLPSGGLFQWNGARFEKMKEFVGADWATDWKGQLDYAMVEDDTSGGYRKYSSINFSTPMAAAEWWLKEWERGNDDVRDMKKMNEIFTRWKESGMVRVSGGTVRWSPDEYISAPSGVTIDRSGEPGVDFTPAGQNNRAMFDGTVLEIKHQYNPNKVGGDDRMGSGYGNYITIRSTDPENGKQYDALYAHFPDGELDRWRPGMTVRRGDVLGRMATLAEFTDPRTRPRVGSGTGPHTSLDFYEPGSRSPYAHWKTNLLRKIDPAFNGLQTSTGSGLDPGRSTNIEPYDPNKKYKTGDYAVFNGKVRQFDGFGWASTGGPTPTTTGGPTSKGYGNGGGKRIPGQGGGKRLSGMTSNQTAALDAIAKHESETSGSWEAVNQVGTKGGHGNQMEIGGKKYGHAGPFSKHPAHRGKVLSNMTLAEVMRLQSYAGYPFNTDAEKIRWFNDGKLHAVGRYQIIGDTLAGLVNNLGLKTNIKFSPALQDYLALHLLKNSGPSQWIGTKKSSPTELFVMRTAMRDLIPSFRAVMTPENNITVNKEPNPPAGPKTLIESLKDDSGLSRFIPPALRNLIPGELQRRSSLMEDMEDAGGTRIQYVIINNAVAVNKPSSVNSSGSSSTTKSTSLSELHLASLGA